MTLPINAAPIEAEWPLIEGGVRACAWTDEYGQAYIAVQTLNRIGKACGLPVWHRGRSFSTEMVVGFIERRPLVIHLRVRVTCKGLVLIIRLPKELRHTCNFREWRFAAWGSETPEFSFMVSPSFDPMASHSYPIL